MLHTNWWLCVRCRDVDKSVAKEICGDCDQRVCGEYMGAHIEYCKLLREYRSECHKQDSVMRCPLRPIYRLPDCVSCGSQFQENCWGGVCPYCMQHMCLGCGEAHLGTCSAAGSESDEAARLGMVLVESPDCLGRQKEQRGSSDEEVWENIHGEGRSRPKGMILEAEDDPKPDLAQDGQAKGWRPSGSTTAKPWEDGRGSRQTRSVCVCTNRLPREW